MCEGHLELCKEDILWERAVLATRRWSPYHVLVDVDVVVVVGSKFVNKKTGAEI